MDASTTVTTVRELSGVTRAQLAQMAGVAPSTLGRIERGEIDPSWSSMMAIMEAAGFRYDNRLKSLQNLSAITAARIAITGTRRTLPNDPAAQKWFERWTRAGLVANGRATPGNVSTLALIAANANKIVDRPGARSFAYTRPWQDIASEIADLGTNWATTGINAANGGHRDATDEWPVFYLENVDVSATATGLIEAAEGQRRVTLLPYSALVDAGSHIDDAGFRWADPVHALIDAYATPGRSADRADAISPKFETREESAA